MKTAPRRTWPYWLLGIALSLTVNPFARAASSWEQPAAQLAAQVAQILGSGQAQLTVNNRSTIATAEVPAIQRLIEQDLHSRGVVISGTESANLIRVTLSENTRERLWVAEVVEGNQTQVAMVHLDRGVAVAPATELGMVLERRRIWSSTDTVITIVSKELPQPFRGPVLAALETPSGLVLLGQEELVVLSRMPTGWREEKGWRLDAGRSLSKDPRGLLRSTLNGNGFTAITPGRRCDGSYATSPDGSTLHGDWSVRCHESDDPWPVGSASVETQSAVIASLDLHAFYNASRDFFTGVVTPNQGADLKPFYTVAALPRPAADHPALLISGIDGRVQLLERNELRAVSGTRDWGSDFAAVHTGCGAGTQVIASGSGEAESDSLRAYEVPAQEAVAVSAALEMGGAVTALWTAPSTTPGADSVWAVVRRNANEYEVDRVTALCP